MRSLRLRAKRAFLTARTRRRRRCAATLQIDMPLGTADSALILPFAALTAEAARNPVFATRRECGHVAIVDPKTFLDRGVRHDDINELDHLGDINRKRKGKGDEKKISEKREIIKRER